jgi:hypothetical protein
MVNIDAKLLNVIVANWIKDHNKRPTNIYSINPSGIYSSYGGMVHHMQKINVTYHLKRRKDKNNMYDHYNLCKTVFDEV